MIIDERPEGVELVATSLACTCVKTHSPPSPINDVHHIVPKSWGGKDVPDNRIVTCPATHRMAHILLSKAVREQRAPRPVELSRLPARVRWLVVEAIARNGGLPKDERVNTPD